MQLHEKGQINIDNPLINYLPYFSLADSRYRQITIKQMLSHTSGFPDVNDYEFDRPQYQDNALEQYVRSLSNLSMIGNPGDNWSYSNMAFEVLGDVIAKLSGTTFEEYERRYVLEPSGMTSTTYLMPSGIPDGWAKPHLQRLKPQVYDIYPYSRIHAPSSTLHTNVIDLCKWAIINMKQGTSESGKILESSTYNTLLGHYFTILNGRGLFHTGGFQALGWAIGNYKGAEIIGHSGSDTGFASMLILVPSRSIAVVLFVNTSNPYLWDITKMVLDAALGLEQQNFIYPATAPVLKTLEEQGVNEAKDQWNLLKRDHPAEYDFSMTYLFSAGTEILNRGTNEEARLLAQLIKLIFTQQEITSIITALEEYKTQNPGNGKPQIMLDILKN